MSAAADADLLTTGKKGPNVIPEGDCGLRKLGGAQQAAPGDCHHLCISHPAPEPLGLEVSTSTRCQGRTD